MAELKICKKCLMLSTRPRLKFDDDGVCSACKWAEEKKTVVDWNARQDELKGLCDKYRRNDGYFDVIVPVSGGKDSSMVAHKLKTKYGMHPLCININHAPKTDTEMNDINLTNFINHGFDTIRVYPNPKVVQKLDREGLIKYGQPYFGWMYAMTIAPIKLAIMFNIPFVMYGEEGEVEYGGSTELKNVATYSIEHVKRLYLSGIDLSDIDEDVTKDESLWWWHAPSEEEIDRIQPAVAHWSYFENWSSEANYKYAKEFVGLKDAPSDSSGTYNNYAQTDSMLYPLHVYFMYLKFGFGRCSQDACIDIRTGSITREEGKELVLKYDDVYPEIYEQNYLDYYAMTKQEWDANIDKWANKELLYKDETTGRWKKNFNEIYD